jgi:methyl-accepting chemotaxis protein
MKLSTRMFCLIAVATIGLILSAASSFLVLQKLKINGAMYKEIVQGKDLAADILPPPEYIIESYLVLQRLQNEPDPGKQQIYVKEFEKLKKEFDGRHEFWKKELPDGDIKKVLIQDSHAPAITFYKTAAESFIPAVLKGDAKTASEIIKSSLDPNYAAHRAHIDKLVDMVNKECTAVEARADASLKTFITVIVVLNVMILSGVLAIGAIISRSIRKQLGGDPSEVHEIVTQVANGNLTIGVHTASNDSSSIMASIRMMVENLRHLISQTVDISSGIASASNQLHATSEHIATGAEEVANQSNTVATASEEMSATSTDIARNCSMAADAAQQTTQSATNGAAIVQETINGMTLIAERVQSSAKTVEALGARSDQIGAIVGTIEDIADQTNLLALNAAIEAARAGEQGRGFAVVADEVRALAERTTRATREIGDMIKAIQKETGEAVKAMEEGVREVEKGTATSMESGQALEEILERINEVSMQINQIATAAEEQTATTGEVSSNILQITDVVHQTARGAEETASAAAQLAGEAQQLQTLVGRFRLA